MDNKSLFINKDIQLKILSPVHVGAGMEKRWMYGIDWVQGNDGASICILNKDKIFNDMDEANLENYTSFMAKGKFQEVVKLLANLGFIEEAYFSQVLPFNSSGEAENDIQNLIRIGTGAPYLPATSIKGAISSVLFRYIWNSKSMLVNEYTKNTPTDLMGNFSSNIMRFIRPADTVIPQTEVNNVLIFNLYQKGKADTWNSAYKTKPRSEDTMKISIEHFSVGATATMRLSISEGILQVIKAKNTSKLPKNHSLLLRDNPIGFLFELINKHSLEHIRKEIEFFETYHQATDIEIVVDKLKALSKKIKAYQEAGSRACVLRLAWGSGFHTVTGDWRFDDHRSTILKPDEKNRTWNMAIRGLAATRYKSRRLVDLLSENGDLDLLGFVELSYA